MGEVACTSVGWNVVASEERRGVEVIVGDVNLAILMTVPQKAAEGSRVAVFQR